MADEETCNKCGKKIEQPGPMPGICPECAQEMMGQFGQVFERILAGKGKGKGKSSVEVRVKLSPEALVNGTTVKLDLSHLGASPDVEVKVPAGTPPGAVLRLKDISTRRGPTDVHVIITAVPAVRRHGLVLLIFGLGAFILGVTTGMAGLLVAAGAAGAVLGVWTLATGRYPLSGTGRQRLFDALVVVAAVAVGLWVYAWMRAGG